MQQIINDYQERQSNEADLQQQVTELSAEVEKLREEATSARSDYDYNLKQLRNDNTSLEENRDRLEHDLADKCIHQTPSSPNGSFISFHHLCLGEQGNKIAN
jgi:predicted nuclease with TOPRIM domain